MTRRKCKYGIKRGGTAIPLESNIFMLNGKSHKNGGIDIDKTVEAQGGEIMRRFGPDQMQILSKENNFIHGNPVKNYLSGMSFDDAFRLQQLDNDTLGRGDFGKAKYGIETEYDRIKRTIINNKSNKSSIPLRASGSRLSRLNYNNNDKTLGDIALSEINKTVPNISKTISDLRTYTKHKAIDSAKERLRNFEYDITPIVFKGIRRKAVWGYDYEDPLKSIKKRNPKVKGVTTTTPTTEYKPIIAPSTKVSTPKIDVSLGNIDDTYNESLNNAKDNIDINNRLRNYYKLNGSWNGFNLDDVLSGGINLAGSLGSFFINNHYLSHRMKEPPVPMLASAPKLRTRYNINPQLSENREGFANAVNNIRNNTASSMTARSSINDYLNSISLANNKLYGDKENKEISLINEDNKLRGEYNTRNVATINDYNNRRNAFYNDIYEKKSENWNSLFNNINAIAQHTIDNKQKRDKARLDYLSTLAPYINIITDNDPVKSNKLYKEIMHGINLV